jgi:nitroimidazol reductase NimA-like FMN-containing flavoprotein (pyridoxamine 5'-phosphate oxidase superfamily)
MDPKKQKVLAFLRTQLMGVISTIANGSSQPESALIAFSETPELELIFGTSNKSRKFANIASNPHVTFVIGFEEMTMQYEGVARVAEGKEVEECRAVHLSKNPRSVKYAFAEDQRYIKVHPTWLRYTDGTVDPDDTFELTF